MKATIDELRGKKNDVPSRQKKQVKITAHPFFGMAAQDSGKSVLEKLDDLRKPRHDAVRRCFL